MKLYTILRNLIQSIKNALQEAKDYSDARGDYIVEQGTSGVWTYRKWASGIAECWGDYQYTNLVANRAFAGGYITASGHAQGGWTFPFTFTSVKTFTPWVTGANAWILSDGGLSTTNTGAFWVIFGTSGTRTVNVRVSVMGYWKTFENVGGVILNLLNRRVVIA